MTETVAVPKALLEDVLETAECDSRQAENLLACDDNDTRRYREDRERIFALRAAAGIE